MNILEFQVSNYITLKLESGKINIYIDGVLFRHCMYVLGTKKFSELEDLSLIDSIDELADNLDHSNWGEPETINIPLETQFWAQCSNLQVWVENDYDTKLLHSNLSFPLLKKLADLGDKRARQRFKEEVVKRFAEGNENVREYIIFENYLEYVDDYAK